MKRIKKALSLLLCLAMLATMTVTGLSFSASADTGKELIVYFANWDIYSLGKNGEVASIPWDRVTYINHAFFQIDKNGEGDFSISSTDSWADMENMGASQVDPTLTLNHFSQYEHFSALYPDVNIMISIGGWTKCGYFSEMASTASGRSSFVQSCIDLMNTYSWIDGIDVDWEYPGVAREPEAGNPSDQGCPVVGDDFTNYTLLLQDMRQGFDSAFGAGAKKLTVCESVNYNTLAHQDCANFHQYVDLINVMTYDMTGTYDPVTGHQAQIYSADPSGYSVDSGVNYLLDKGVPASKINIGSPVYSHGWGSVVPDANGNVLGVAGSSTGYQGDLRWNQLKKLQNKAVAEGEEGWHYYFDNEAKASYLYNDNPNSNYYQNFFTYDSEAAIVSKAQYINEKGLAGIILWEAGGDSLSDDAPFISLLASSLGIYEGQVPAYTGADIEDPEVIDSGEPDENAFQNPIYEVQAATGWDFVTFPTGTQIYYKGAIYESINDGSNDFYGNLPDGQWGDGCWKKICDVKPYVSQEENGGTWAYVANKDDHVLYNPDRDVNADLWLALADNDNMANNAPDGIWGHSIWKYETTIILLEAPGGIKEYINEAEVGTGSKSFPAGTQIYYNDAIWESKSPSANDAADNMPGGAAGDAYWKKVVDLVNYGDGIADAGSYVFYNPDGDYTAQVYLSLNGANTDPAADATNWELASTVTLIYHPKYADGATVATLEADPLFFGEFQTRPFMKDGVEVSSYPAGAVVSYNGKYYENYVSGSSAWDDGWEPNVHGNWHEIYITQEGDDRIPTMQCPIYEIENYLNGNTPYATYPTGTLVYYNGRVWKSNMDTADNWTGNLPDGEWGDAVWTEMFVVKPYISQEENGGAWAYVADEGDMVLYNPDKTTQADVYLALAQNDNLPDNAPDGIWGDGIWQYQTTIILLNAPKEINDPIKEVATGDGSVGYPKGSQIFYKDAIWKSINDNSNDWPGNMPDGEWGEGCWSKLMDAPAFDGSALAGDTVLYNPDGDLTGVVYKALVDTENDPETAPNDWEYVTTVKLLYHPKYANGASLITISKDPLFFGEFQTRPFVVDGVEYASYPAGAVVSYNGKYYENYVDGSSAWDDGWQPDVHGNWHEIEIYDINIYRFYGTSRIDTALSVSEAWGAGSVETVVLANGYSFADSLAGAPLAYAYESPLLLTAGKTLEESVLAEIERLGAQKVVILGGSAAVSEEVEAALADYEVERLYGTTRADTAKAIADRLFELSGKPDEVFLAYGYNFADALAVSSVAAMKGSPILYVAADGSLYDATTAYITEKAIDNAVILGGTGAVGAACEDNLDALGVTNERIFGTTRCDTALAIVEAYDDLYNKNAQAIAFATCDEFADALSGGVLSAALEIPFLLVSDTRAPAEGIEDYIASYDVKTVIVYGGEGALKTETIENLL